MVMVVIVVVVVMVVMVVVANYTYEQVFLMTTKFSLMDLGPSFQSTCCLIKLAVEVI